MKKIEGVVVPILTPIHEDETPYYEQLAALTDYVIDGGVNAIFVNGTSGEFARFTQSERAGSVGAVVRAANGRVPVLAGVSDCGTRLVIDNARRAADNGADAVVTTLPYYFPTVSPTEQRLFIEAVLNASPVPVLLYNIPSVIGRNIDLSALDAASDHPNLYGIKDTSGDGQLFGTLVERYGSKIQLFMGDEGLLFKGLQLGAVGMVPSLANAFPKLLRDIWQAAQNEDWESCKELCETLSAMNNLNGYADGWMCPNVWRKEALHQMGIIDATFTNPHIDMTDADKAQVAERIRLYQSRWQ